MSKVAIVRCESYDYGEIKKSVHRGIKLLGGISRFAHKGNKILLKPNLLTGDRPERCVTTHPLVFEAVAELLLTTGAKVSYGDSPPLGSPGRAAQRSGLAEKAKKLNIELADFKTKVDIFYDKGIQNKKFTIAKAVLDNDILISLPKLKTHGLAKFTGAVKNQFGCIPGVLKGEFHVRLPSADDFARMLVDLNMFINPKLYITDGVQGMEGNGPRGGTPVKMNMLLFSKDPIALDATICRLINLNPEYVPTIKYGKEAGAGTFAEDEIELVGDQFDSFKNSAFEIDRQPLKPYKQGSVLPFINRAIVPKPFIMAEKCIQCGICVTMCPLKPKALSFKENDKSCPPVYNYNDCIRCFCCQEMCPESAIQLKTPVLRKIIDLF